MSLMERIMSVFRSAPNKEFTDQQAASDAVLADVREILQEREGHIREEARLAALDARLGLPPPPEKLRR